MTESGIDDERIAYLQKRLADLERGLFSIGCATNMLGADEIPHTVQQDVIALATEKFNIQCELQDAGIKTIKE